MFPIIKLITSLLLLATFVMGSCPSSGGCSRSGGCSSSRGCSSSGECSGSESDTCVNDGNHVYALGAVWCFVFEDCDSYREAVALREARGQPPLRIVSKAACQRKCPDCCPNDNPLCAHKGGIRKSFDSACDMIKYNCENDETFVFGHYGYCGRSRCSN